MLVKWDQNSSLLLNYRCRIMTHPRSNGGGIDATVTTCQIRNNQRPLSLSNHEEVFLIASQNRLL